MPVISRNEKSARSFFVIVPYKLERIALVIFNWSPFCSQWVILPFASKRVILLKWAISSDDNCLKASSTRWLTFSLTARSALYARKWTSKVRRTESVSTFDSGSHPIVEISISDLFQKTRRTLGRIVNIEEKVMNTFIVRHFSFLQLILSRKCMIFLT